jgi:hypothetical protein
MAAQSDKLAPIPCREDLSIGFPLATFGAGMDLTEHLRQTFLGHEGYLRADARAAAEQKQQDRTATKL